MDRREMILGAKYFACENLGHAHRLKSFNDVDVCTLYDMVAQDEGALMAEEAKFWLANMETNESLRAEWSTLRKGSSFA